MASNKLTGQAAIRRAAQTVQLGVLPLALVVLAGLIGPHGPGREWLIIGLAGIGVFAFFDLYPVKGLQI